MGGRPQRQNQLKIEHCAWTKKTRTSLETSFYIHTKCGSTWLTSGSVPSPTFFQLVWVAFTNLRSSYDVTDTFFCPFPRRIYITSKYILYIYIKTEDRSSWRIPIAPGFRPATWVLKKSTPNANGASFSGFIGHQESKNIKTNEQTKNSSITFACRLPL